MLTIDRLALRLPAGLESRAGRIVALIGQELAAGGEARSRRIDRLSVPPLHLDPALSDRQIAARVATSIRNSLDRAV
jgi:hypothetical protein